jgi:hypothetical protein
MKNQNIASAVGYEPDSTSVQWGRDRFQIDLREGFLCIPYLVKISLKMGHRVSSRACIGTSAFSSRYLKTLRAHYQSYISFLGTDAD